MESTPIGQIGRQHHAKESADTDTHDSPSPSHLQSEYSTEEVTELIRLALERANLSSEHSVSASELKIIGKDLGLTEEDLLAASEEVLKRRNEEDQVEHAMRHVKLHVVCYRAIGFGLFLLNMFTTPDMLWFAFPAVAYGPFVAIYAYMAKQHPEIALYLFEE